VAADSADPDAFGRVVASVERVDLLVHAAGVMDGTFVRKESLVTFESVVRTNLTSAFVVAHAVLPVMPVGGRLVFLSSSSAHAPQPGKTAYSASKAGLNAFAAALGKEVERDGIAVHVVTTGPVATPMLDDVHFPMRTLGVDEVARTVVWLDTLPGNVVLPEVEVSSVEAGPFAPEPFVPEAARKLGRTEI
jgi:NAD(P)-dependent dehydrogenase (short-subunit alcohol dehydrogenase family)